MDEGQMTERDGPPMAGPFDSRGEAEESAARINEEHGGAPFPDPEFGEPMTAVVDRHVDGWWGVWPMFHADPARR